METSMKSDWSHATRTLVFLISFLKAFKQYFVRQQFRNWQLTIWKQCLQSVYNKNKYTLSVQAGSLMFGIWWKKMGDEKKLVQQGDRDTLLSCLQGLLSHCPKYQHHSLFTLFSCRALAIKNATPQHAALGRPCNMTGHRLTFPFQCVFSSCFVVLSSSLLPWNYIIEPVGCYYLARDIFFTVCTTLLLSPQLLTYIPVVLMFHAKLTLL